MVTQRSGGRASGSWRRALLCGCAGLALVALSSSRWGSAGAAQLPEAAPATAAVVAATDLPAGSVVTDSMLTTTGVPVVIGGLVKDASTLRGRVLLVPVARGEPVGFGMTAPRPVASAGRRLIRVSVGSIDVAPDVVVGRDADVVASFAPAATGQRPEVSIVATVRVVALEQRPDTAAVQAPADPIGSPAGPTTSATLDCASADALRILWARDNARTLRLLSHPDGEVNPPPAIGSV
jgi:Flp pilus assembly protein CpaB